LKHFIYKTTNIMNGKYYIGAHSTNDVNDGYLGSGKLLRKSIEKYGKENFIREILFYCENIEELYNKESQIISEHLDNNMCYNVKPGGKGGWYSVNNLGIHRGTNNVMNRCPELKRQIIENGRLTRLKNKEYYDNISRVNGAKAKEKCTGVKCPAKGSSERSKKVWRENYEKMRDSLSNYFLVQSPTGEKYTTNRLEDFCKEKNLTYTSLWNTSRTNKQVKKGKSKGWSCKKISQL
jgi:hypothetical protein